MKDNDVYLRCKNVINSWLDFVKDCEDCNFEEQVIHLVEEIYSMGYEDASTLMDLANGKIIN